VSALHITNGDCAADKLREFLADPVTITADVLYEGPAPAADGDAWYRARASFLSSSGDAVGHLRRELEEWDRMIATSGQHDEVTLWFEHDLFDQLQLIRTLDVLARVKPDTAEGATTRAFLICIDRFPGVERFIGLGQLSATELATLVEKRQPVTAEQLALASEAWAAFRAPDPTRLVALMRRLKAEGATAALPFLGDALHRLLEEYPSVVNGLSRTDNAMLHEIERAPMIGIELFAASQAREERPFMGDLTAFDRLRDLARSHMPLVTIAPADGAVDLRRHTVSITETGRDVLMARRDAVVINGIDLWRGGVHLSGSERSLWRWDARRETLVS
jgi:Domain of unknown function (DUF1835)